MCIKLIKHCSIFYKLLKILKQVYFAFVHSHTLSTIEIYAGKFKIKPE